MFKCIECGYEFDPSNDDSCPLCGGGRDMEVSYKDTFTVAEVVVCTQCGEAFDSLIGSKVCSSCTERRSPLCGVGDGVGGDCTACDEANKCDYPDDYPDNDLAIAHKAIEAKIKPW